MGSISNTDSKKLVSDSDIETLRALLSDTNAQVLAPSDKGYAASLERWSRAAEKPAGVSILPTNAEEVSIAVKYVTEHGLDLAVKGGGHSTAGVSSTDGGVLIDLSKMRNVRVEGRLISAEGGCLWSDVDNAAWEHGLATVGGTVADTGIGGLTLGGGYGHLTGSYGLVIDNIISITVVLANGKITKASKDKNSGLFWALLGAGQNFGVSVEFVLRGYPHNEAYAGAMVFISTPEIIEKLVVAANDLWKVQETPKGPQTKAQGKAASVLALVKPPGAPSTMILLLSSFIGTEEEGKKFFQPFSDIGPVQDSMALHPWPKVNNLVPAPAGMRSSMKGAAFLMPLRTEFVTKIIAEHDAFLSRICPEAEGTLIAWELYDTVKTTQLDNGCYANRGHHLNGLIMPVWASKENDQTCRQWARDVSNMFKAELEEHGGEASASGGRKGHKGAVMLYGNYDQYDEISKDIFGENYERLQQIKAEYDPTNMFNKLFPITPAVVKP